MDNVMNNPQRINRMRQKMNLKYYNEYKKNPYYPYNPENITKKMKQKYKYKRSFQNKNYNINKKIRFNGENILEPNSFLMPNTKVLQYIFNKYGNYVDYKNYMSTSKNDDYVVKMNDLFIINNNIINNKKKVNINSEFGQNPSFSLDKMLAYSLYTTTPNWFNDTIYYFLKEYTYQIGKDLTRNSYIINGDNKYNASYFQDLVINSDGDIKHKSDEIDNSDYKPIYETDKRIVSNYYYNTLKNIGKKMNNKLLNDDIINKICVLSIQNIHNFMFTNLIAPWISSFIQPEQAFITGNQIFPSKITIDEKNVTFEINIKCNLLFTKDNIPDPDIPYGNMSAYLFFDLINNTYKLKNLKVNYDLTSSELDNIQDNKYIRDKDGNIIQKSKGDIMQNIGNVTSNPYVLYGAAALGLSGAIIALPFLLGGKTKKKYKNIKHKKNKTHKNKKNVST